MFDFSGRYAVVTGGARGIGEAIVRRFIADKAAGVAILDVDDSSVLARELDPAGEKILSLRCDIADSEAAAAAFRQIYARFSRVDFLINNAGIARDAMFHKMSEESWDAVIGVNVKGAFNCTRQVIVPMRNQEYGRIIFTSSIAIYGAVGQCNYSASKGALYALTKNLAREQARKKITVNCIIPGPINTGLLQSVPAKPGEPNPDAPRAGEPRDVASLVAYLCTEDAHFISGAQIDINGGIR